jgi:hypothetical protein
MRSLAELADVIVVAVPFISPRRTKNTGDLRVCKPITLLSI